MASISEETGRVENDRDVHRDSLDFRDRIYQPALVALRSAAFPNWDHVEILNQESEGACTGFALAAVINYLNRTRGVGEPVSPRMLYEMAKRHDQWPGEDYEGSSARGVMKGWYKNGVCPEEYWPYSPGSRGYLTWQAQQAALRYPLGAYYRIMPRRSDVHAALHQVPAILATAATHQGWATRDQAKIAFDPSWPAEGGHAFAIVGYTDEGFIIQNSWGESWGRFEFDGDLHPGIAIWQYADFEKNLWDAWVARMARPVESVAYLTGERYEERPSGIEIVEKAPPRHAIRNHYIHIDDGQFDPKGDYDSREEEVQEIIQTAVTGNENAPPKHILLYAHGGLNSIKASAARVGKWRPVFQANDIHEIHFIWETGLWAELRDVLLGKQEFVTKRAGGPSGWWDLLIERTTRPLGHPVWKEMISDAELAFEENKAGTKTLTMLSATLKTLPEEKRPRLHLVGHSAGSIWFSHLLDRWKKVDAPPIDTLILFAPACTHQLFEDRIRPALRGGRVVQHLHHFILDDKTECDDNVALVYRKSLLYLVSRSYQKRGEVVPLMGMEKYLPLPDQGVHKRLSTYNTRDNPDVTKSSSHGGFDNDGATMNSMLRFVLGAEPERSFQDSDLSGY
jgi:hypothetical protein